jgi:hypothetical protein
MMSDVLFANADDDVFWPPTERTEAQAAEVASHPEAWAFTFLGSRVHSFAPAPDRVIVYQRALGVDIWALGPRSPMHSLLLGSWLPSGWEPRPIAMCFTSLVEVRGAPHMTGLVGEVNPTDPQDDVDDPASEWPSAVVGSPTVDAAVTDVKEWLGLNDLQIEAATGISRSTLWRLRTGRTVESRSTTDAPVWRLHALAAALTRVLGSDGARGWLHAGQPSPAQLLETGHLSDVERVADRVLFPDPSRQPTFAGVADDDYDTVGPSSPPPASQTRRPRRAHQAPRRPT